MRAETTLRPGQRVPGAGDALARFDYKRVRSCRCNPTVGLGIPDAGIHARELTGHMTALSRALDGNRDDPRPRKTLIWVIRLAIAAWLAGTAVASALDLLPKTFPLAVMGVKVGLPVSISFDANTVGDKLQLKVRAQASLKGVQDNALAIARAIPMPKGNCDREHINPVVNSIDSASITPSGTNAVVTISGRVTAWVCEHPFGATVKTILASDNVTITTPVRVVVVNQNQVGVQLAGPVTVRTGNALTAEVANLLAGDVNSLIAAQLAKALDASEARMKLPDMPGLEATIESAAFAAQGDQLLVRAAGTGLMTSEVFSKLLETINK